MTCYWLGFRVNTETKGDRSKTIRLQTSRYFKACCSANLDVGSQSKVREGFAEASNLNLARQQEAKINRGKSAAKVPLEGVLGFCGPTQ